MHLLYSPMILLFICLTVFEFTSVFSEYLLLQWRAVVYLATATFYNSMACRVFRILRLFPLDSHTTSIRIEMSNLRFHDPLRVSEERIISDV